MTLDEYLIELRQELEELKKRIEKLEIFMRALEKKKAAKA